MLGLLKHGASNVVLRSASFIFPFVVFWVTHRLTRVGEKAAAGFARGLFSTVEAADEAS